MYRTLLLTAFLVGLVCPSALGGDSTFDWTWKDSTGAEHTSAELKQLLRDHRRWYASDGVTGSILDLSGATLTHSDLRRIDLSHIVMQGCTLDSADLRKARLDGANLTGASLIGARADSASFIISSLFEANLRGCILIHSNLSGADLTGAILDNADMRGADLSLANLIGAKLSSAMNLDPDAWPRNARFDRTTEFPPCFSPDRQGESAVVDTGVRGSGEILGIANQDMITIVGMLAGVMAILVGMLTYRSVVKRGNWEELMTAMVEAQAEKPAEKKDQETIADYVATLLRDAEDHPRLLMKMFLKRSNGLFRISAAFSTASIFFPMIAAIAYVAYRPGGQADWHLLAAGLSFGLLFIAAARGLAAQDARQRSIYLAFEQRITYYRHLIAAVRIAHRLENESDKHEAGTAIGGIIEKLMTSGHAKLDLGDEPGDQGVHVPASGYALLLRIITDALKGSKQT